MVTCGSCELFVAVAATTEMLPYFPRVMELLKVPVVFSKLNFITCSLSLQDCLSSPTEKNTFMLQAQAIDTLGILARNIGREKFLPLAAECIEMGKVTFHLYI